MSARAAVAGARCYVPVTHDVAEAPRLDDRVLVLGGIPSRFTAMLPTPPAGAPTP